MTWNWARIKAFMRLSRPHFLAGAALLYGLGAAIADYLGHAINLRLYLLGQLLVTSIQLATHYLNEYYDSPADNSNPNRTLFSGGSGALDESGLPRDTALIAAIVALTVAATLSAILLVGSRLSLTAWVLLALSFLGAFFYSAPPLRLIESGYGEVVASLIVGGLLPGFSFALQAADLHRFVPMAAAPLVALHFAMIIALELPDYGTDLKFKKRTLMVRMGWSAAMRLHDAAILAGLLALAGAGVVGLPPKVVIGGLIALPLAGAQLWQMERIRRGLRPQWRLLTINAVGLFGLTAYLEMIGFIWS